jgi:hypothetical protein
VDNILSQEYHNFKIERFTFPFLSDTTTFENLDEIDIIQCDNLDKVIVHNSTFIHFEDCFNLHIINITGSINAIKLIKPIEEKQDDYFCDHQVILFSFVEKNTSEMIDIIDIHPRYKTFIFHGNCKRNDPRFKEMDTCFFEIS